VAEALVACAEGAWRIRLCQGGVLGAYARPYDPQRPVACFDEAGKELRAAAHAPTPARPGQAARRDGTCERRGAAKRFLRVCPLLGWRQGALTQRRTKVDLAQRRKAPADEHSPQAEWITLAQDNLNTPPSCALYEASPAAGAKRVAGRLEWVYTPAHARWLNGAEREWSVLVRRCLGRRIATAQALAGAVEAWAKARNAAGVEITWSFRVPDARVRLAHLYPANSL
jgi:hypothetical protein